MHEKGARIIGFAIAVIGWFYVFVARTNRNSFGLATLEDRMLLAAFVLPLVFARPAWRYSLAQTVSLAFRAVMIMRSESSS